MRRFMGSIKQWRARALRVCCCFPPCDHGAILWLDWFAGLRTACNAAGGHQLHSDRASQAATILGSCRKPLHHTQPYMLACYALHSLWVLVLALPLCSLAGTCNILFVTFYLQRALRTLRSYRCLAVKARSTALHHGTFL